MREDKQLLRVQIKGTGTRLISFVGGYRSGKQILREAPSRTYKYTEKHCDLIIGINTCNDECYIIPIQDIKDWGTSKNIKHLQQYKENWQILIGLAKRK